MTRFAACAFALLSFFMTALSARAEKPRAKDLMAPMRQAVEGFMLHCPDAVPGRPGLQRAAFMCMGLPVPMIAHDQWDWGDCTARAVNDWIWYREMTHEATAGVDMEKAQKAALLYVLAPETGLAFVPDRSKPDQGIYHCQMWDQGRTLRALVLWWQTEPDATVRKDLQQRIDRMVVGMEKLAQRSEDPKYGPCAVYPFDFVEGERRGDDLYCVRGGQLIEPLAIYYDATGRADVRRFLDALYAGVRSGREGAHYDESHRILFVFGDNGSFNGHFHAHVSTALGVARYGLSLAKRGEKARALDLLRWARRVYDWTLSPDNVNAGSSWGWFPENIGTGNSQAREMSETCCVADMIEFAAVLAGAATMDASLADWDGLWDHVERYTFNYILPAQFHVTSIYERLLARVQAEMPVLRNGYLEMELDPAGVFNHETVSRQTIRREHQSAGAISQVSYAVEYGGKSAFFEYAADRPLQPRGLRIERPTCLQDGRLVGAVRTVDERLRVESEVTAGAGPYFVWRFRLTNTGSDRIDRVRFSWFANADTPEWVKDHACLNGDRDSVILSGPAANVFIGVRAEPRPDRITLGDAGKMLAGQPPYESGDPVVEFTGNSAMRFAWVVESLAGGASLDYTLTIATCGNEAELAKALSRETFPSRTPADPATPLLAIAKKMDGSWISCLYPNDRVGRDDAGRPIFYTGGCCAYSGPRGLYACWNTVSHDADGVLSIRLPVSRDDKVMKQEVVEGPDRVVQRVTIKATRRVRVRIPDWADVEAVVVKVGEDDRKVVPAGRWLDCGSCPAGVTLTVTYPLVTRKTTEKVAGSGKSLWFCPADQKRSFTATWRGNRVIAIEPAGVLWPLFAAEE